MEASNSIKVGALTGGINDPASRFRIRQLIPTLEKQGIFVHEFIPLVDKYPPEWKLVRPIWGISAILTRIPAVLATYSYDVVVLQRELISTLVTLEPLTKCPRVLDVDDAIFVYRNGRPAAKLAQMCDAVVCGNEFLADKFSNWNSNVFIVPTSVDTSRYVPLNPLNKNNNERLIIGWIGTSGNFQYLYKIERALEEILRIWPNAVFRVVADKEPRFTGLVRERLEFVRWSELVEVSSIQSMDVGIMPLDDNDWTRGKCSFKMLQYMACGIPVVVSPVGMNAKVLSLGEVGLAATSTNDWVEALLELLSLDIQERIKLGMEGRRIVENYFSVDVVALQFSNVLRKILL